MQEHDSGTEVSCVKKISENNVFEIQPLQITVNPTYCAMFS